MAGSEPDDRSRPTERIAALVALGSLCCAVVLAATGAAAHWLGLAASLALLPLIVTAGWYAVSRRGVRRSLAVTVALAGVSVLIVGLVVADSSVRRVVGVVVLAGISIGAARVALRRSRRALREQARARTPAPPARHPVLIMNPWSGGGKVERHRLVDECRARGIESVVLEPGDDLLQVAEAAIAAGADVIGMAGGDGSQALVATAASRHGIPHVVVPAGTRNHLALDLGLDRDDVIGALDAYHDGIERRIDLATVNGQIFVNNATVGLYAKIVQAPEYRDAKRSTVIRMLPDLIGPGAEPPDLRFTGPDGTTYPTADVILVANGPYELHRFAGRGTRETIDNGRLGIVAARVADARQARHLAALAATGRSRHLPGWLEWNAPTFRIDSDELVAVGIDGEAAMLAPPLVFETRPGALRVRLPRHATGRSPTARAVHLLSRSTLTHLIRIASGRGGVPDEHAEPP
jgi:diacylglycerol kinase family enzyme